MFIVNISHYFITCTRGSLHTSPSFHMDFNSSTRALNCPFRQHIALSDEHALSYMVGMAS